MSEVKIEILKRRENAVAPQSLYSETANFYDLYCCITDAENDIEIYSRGKLMKPKNLREKLFVEPGESARVPIGFSFKIPDGYFGDIRTRASLFKRMINVSGIVGSDYRGEVYVIIQNNDTERLILSHGDRIAQIAIISKNVPKFIIVDRETFELAGK